MRKTASKKVVITLPRERNHVHRQLPQVRVQLAREAERGCDPTHGERHEMIKISIGWVDEFEGPEANVVESFVVDAVGFVCVLDELVHGEGGVVRFHHSVRHLRRRYDGIRVHDAVGIFFSDLGYEESSHARAGAAPQTVGQLEALQTVRGLRLLPDNIQDTVHQLGPLGVVALGPVVASSALSEDEVVRPKERAVRAGADAVHGAGLEIHQHRSWHVLAAAGLVIIDVDPLELQVGLALVGAGGVNPVLIAAEERN